MTKGLLLVGSLLIATAEPVLGTDDLVRYAITQGGLFAVIVVLLWYIRELHKEKAQTIAVLTDLVGQTNATMEKTIAVGGAQEKAIDHLAHVLERIL